MYKAFRAVVIALGLFALAAVLAEPVQADEVPMHVYDDGSTTIRLMGGPCVDPRVMEMIVAGMPQHAAHFRAIESTFKMHDGSRKDFTGCWVELTAEEVGAESFFMLFEDGDYYLVQTSEFVHTYQDV